MRFRCSRIWIVVVGLWMLSASGLYAVPRHAPAPKNNNQSLLKQKAKGTQQTRKNNLNQAKAHLLLKGSGNATNGAKNVTKNGARPSEASGAQPSGNGSSCRPPHHRRTPKPEKTPGNPPHGKPPLNPPYHTLPVEPALPESEPSSTPRPIPTGTPVPGTAIPGTNPHRDS